MSRARLARDERPSGPDVGCPHAGGQAGAYARIVTINDASACSFVPVRWRAAARGGWHGRRWGPTHRRPVLKSGYVHGQAAYVEIGKGVLRRPSLRRPRAAGAPPLPSRSARYAPQGGSRHRRAAPGLTGRMHPAARRTPAAGGALPRRFRPACEPPQRPTLAGSGRSVSAARCGRVSCCCS